ncbi:hypothetical protein V7014_20810 [Bacillus sp. JJ722]
MSSAIFARSSSVDTMVLLERVAKEISGAIALQIVDRIREIDAVLTEIDRKAAAFFGKETFQALRNNLMQYLLPCFLLNN